MDWWNWTRAGDKEQSKITARAKIKPSRSICCSLNSDLLDHMSQTRLCLLLKIFLEEENCHIGPYRYRRLQKTASLNNTSKTVVKSNLEDLLAPFNAYAATTLSPYSYWLSLSGNLNLLSNQDNRNLYGVLQKKRFDPTETTSTLLIKGGTKLNVYTGTMCSVWSGLLCGRSQNYGRWGIYSTAAF